MESDHPYNLECVLHKHESVACPTSALSNRVPDRSTTPKDWSCTGTVPFVGDPNLWVGPKVGIGEQRGSGTLITVEHGWVSRKEVRILLKLTAYQHAYGVFLSKLPCAHGWLPTSVCIKYARTLSRSSIASHYSMHLACPLEPYRWEQIHRASENRQPRRPGVRNRCLYVMGRFFLTCGRFEPLASIPP